MNKHLAALFACLFVVMVGFGVTIPVLPFYAERLALQEGASRGVITLHVTLLTSIYALMQLLSAPLWGRWSDKLGRRQLVLIGMAGVAASQVIFGLATSLGLLYFARVAGGILSSAIFPAAAAYVSDESSAEGRNRSMAWMGGAVTLGAVTGMAIGGMASPKDLHFFNKTYEHFKINSFSVPFFAAAAMMLLTFFAAARWLPKSVLISTNTSLLEKRKMGKTDWRELGIKLRLLLGLAVAGQFGLTMFEATFALYAQEKMGYGPQEVGMAFMVCGLTMAVFQVVAVGYLFKRISAGYQIAMGFSLMGAGIALLLLLHTMPLVLASIFVLALGMALISPNIATLVTIRGDQHTGAAVGLQSAADSLGQVGGPLLGGALFAWNAQAPYWVAGAFLLGLGLFVGWKECFSKKKLNPDEAQLVANQPI